MKMQMEPNIQVKERFFYFPATFDTLENIVRNGFTIRTGEDGIKFYTNSEIANLEINSKTSHCLCYNRRFILMLSIYNF